MTITVAVSTAFVMCLKVAGGYEIHNFRDQDQFLAYARRHPGNWIARSVAYGRQWDYIDHTSEFDDEVDPMVLA